MRKSKLSQEQQEFLIKNYSKLGGHKCSEILFVPLKLVRSFCEKRKMKLDDSVLSQIRLNTINHARNIRDIKKMDFSSYDVDPDQFLNPRTAEVAYILGLLWAL